MPKHVSLHFLYCQQDKAHSTPLPCLYILKFLSLRINWRASVNLLIDQVSALVPTLFFVLVTLRLRGSLHPPFHHNFGHLFLQLFKTFTSQVPSARMPKHFSLHFLYCQQDKAHSTPLPCLYILKFLSLRINWRASVNLLIDQVSALVPTLFFVIVTLRLRGSLHPPFHHNFGHLFLQLFKTFTSQVPSARMPKHFSLHFLYCQQDKAHSTPLPCLYILKFLSLRINWRASVNLLIDQVSALVPTLFFVIVTLRLRGSLHPPFHHNFGHLFLQLFKTFTSQVPSARMPKHVSLHFLYCQQDKAHSTPLPCLYILRFLSLRINWRASVNLLIDQVSALVPTLFFVIVTLRLRGSLHPPFHHNFGHLFLQLFKTFTSQVPSARMPKHVSLHFLYCQQDKAHSTPLPCLYILKFLSLRINWRASVNLLIDQVSALVPTLFFAIVTLRLRGSLHPPFHHNFGHLFLQLFKTFTSQVPSARMPKHVSLHFLYCQQDKAHSTPLPCLYILKFLSLRINWRASVNLLIDQVSALVPTLFFAIVVPVDK